MLNNRSLTSTIDRMLTLNRAIDEAWASAAGQQARRVWVPAFDVVERKDAYLVYAELPGVDPSQVDLSFEHNVLTIRGTKNASVEVKEGGELRVFAAERVSGAFERSLRVPEFVDGDRITAEYTNGVLTVTIPKGRAAQPRKIEIRGAEAPQQVKESSELGSEVQERP